MNNINESDDYLRDDMLNNMLNLEKYYLPPINSKPSSKQSLSITNYSQSNIRKIIANSIHGICEQESISNDVFPLTMNLFDRYCSLFTQYDSYLIKSVELIALSCYQIAKKIRHTLTNSIQNYKICLILNDYTDDEIFDAEQTICDKLDWDLASIIPHDYIDLILKKLPFNEIQRIKIKQHVEILLCLCICEYECSTILPSLVACGCIQSAVKGLYSKFDVMYDSHLLSQIIKSNKNDIDHSQMIVEKIVQTRLQDLHVSSISLVESVTLSPSSRRCLISIENNQNSSKTSKQTSFCIVR